MEGTPAPVDPGVLGARIADEVIRRLGRGDDGALGTPSLWNIVREVVAEHVADDRAGDTCPTCSLPLVTNTPLNRRRANVCTGAWRHPSGQKIVGVEFVRRRTVGAGEITTGAGIGKHEGRRVRGS